MKILIVGSEGSMGKRYTAILKYLGHETVLADIVLNSPPIETLIFDRAIICTPTDTHYTLCLKFIQMGKDFLCEKPVSKNPDEIALLNALCEERKVDGRIICNWAFVHPPFLYEPKKNKIIYKFYNTGKDGLLWDCIQLVYLSEKKPTIISSSPIFHACINTKIVTLDQICESYVTMLKTWIYKSSLWNLKDAEQASRKVLKILAGG